VFSSYSVVHFRTLQVFVNDISYIESPFSYFSYLLSLSSNSVLVFESVASRFNYLETADFDCF